MVSSRWAVSLVSLGLLGLVGGGCSSGDDSKARGAEHRGRSSAQPRDTMLADTLPAECALGKRPDYFVPGDGAALLVGCARLGVSQKGAEFSLNLGRLEGKAHLCVNLAYTGRGRPGFYIPAICKLNPPPARFAVRDVAQPRQGVRGYALVIWGTAPPGTPAVDARFSHTTGAAGVFTVAAKWARQFGEPPFTLFIVELPLRAACGPITVRDVRSGATARIGRRPKLCERS
jgi:hypothetical protein